MSSSIGNQNTLCVAGFDERRGRGREHSLAVSARLWSQRVIVELSWFVPRLSSHFVLG